MVTNVPECTRKVIITVRKNGSRRVGLDCGSETCTQQQFKDDCDINNIVKRYGSAAFNNQYDPNSFRDVASYPDYQEGLEIVLRAEDQFMSLPSTVRDRFKNDPAKFLEFVHDPKNQDEAVKLGLVCPKPAEVISKVEIVNSVDPNQQKQSKKDS